MAMEKVMVRGVAVRLHHELKRQIDRNLQSVGQKEEYTEHQIEGAVMAWFNVFTVLRWMEVNRVGSDLCQGLSVLLQQSEDGVCLDRLMVQVRRLAECVPYVFHRAVELDEGLRPQCVLGHGGILSLLVEEMGQDVWRPVQILGWMFQYANGQKKDEVFRQLKNKIKIGKQSVPVATQLFTPQWIVRYMAENSLAMKLQGGKRWKYQERGNKQSDAVHDRLKEILKKKRPEEIRCIDPCMGSGHILVELFDLLTECYRQIGVKGKEAACRILKYNLYGVDIDPVVSELAGISLFLKASLYSGELIGEQIHVACCEYDEEWIRVKEKYPEMTESVIYLDQVMSQASVAGALLKPEKMDYEGLLKKCETRQSRQMVSSAAMLSEEYDVVITNPPYLSTSGMDREMQEYLKKHYPDTCMDLSIAMMQRSQSLACRDGLIAMINIPVWMTLSSYSRYRQSLLNQTTLLSMLLMGRGVFGSDFGTCVFVMLNQRVMGYKGSYRKLYDKKSEVESVSRKEKRYFSDHCRYIQDQQDFLQLPGTPVAYALNEKLRDSFERGQSVDSLASVRQGMATGNNEKYLRFWFEVPVDQIAFGCHDLEEFLNSHKKYVPYNKGGAYCKWYGNQDYVLCFDEQSRKDLAVSGNRMPSRQYYFNPCLTWSKVTIGGFSMRMLPAGFVFDVSGCSVFTDRKRSLELLGFFNSPAAARILSYFSPTVNYEVGHIKALPVLPYMDEQTQNRIEENIELSRQDRGQFETCFEFECHPLICGLPLQKAMEQWKQQCQSRYDRVRENEEKINEKIDQIYQNPVEEQEKTVITMHHFCETRSGKDRWCITESEAVKSLLSYAAGCLTGRYSLKKKGIINDPKKPGYLVLKENTIMKQLREWLQEALQKVDVEEDLCWIAQHLAGRGSCEDKIGHYMVTQFYRDHCRYYQNHPLYWLFSGSHLQVLVYCHQARRAVDELIVQNEDPQLAAKLKKHAEKEEYPDPEKGFKMNLEVFKDCMMKN